jgi:hypothetical protein
MDYILAIIFLLAGAAVFFTAAFVYGWIMAFAMATPLIAVGIFFIAKGDKADKKKWGRE